jgi:hypothetical protein
VLAAVLHGNSEPLPDALVAQSHADRWAVPSANGSRFFSPNITVNGLRDPQIVGQIVQDVATH